MAVWEDALWVTWRALPTVSELQEEGMNAINLPLSPTQYELDPEDTMLGKCSAVQCSPYLRSLAIEDETPWHWLYLILLSVPTEENEVRTMVDPNSKNDQKLQELQKVLIDWINDVLVGERIIVKDLAEDLYDGQVLQKLFGEEQVHLMVLHQT